VRIQVVSGKSSRMDTGQWLTRGTIWGALTLYVAAEVIRFIRRAGASEPLARALNSLGCLAFLAHVACAFHYYHHWSHTAAYADTARQTNIYFGWDWGGGLYFNYAFLLLWVGQAIHSWATPPTSSRAGWLAWILRGFVMLMMVNGAVVFAHGPLKWFGLLLCLLLILCWWPRSAGQRCT
jgi:hypothetical protein